MFDPDDFDDAYDVDDPKHPDYLERADNARTDANRSPADIARLRVLLAPFRQATYGPDDERIDCDAETVLDEDDDPVRCNRAHHRDGHHMAVTDDGSRVWLLWP